MKAQIPWLRVFVEGVVIVLSILLAFGIDAWWDGVQERAEEQQLLVGLRQEIASNHEGLEGDRRNVQQGLLRLRTFVQMGPDEMAAIDPDSVFVAIYEPMRRTYSTRLTTGFLEATVSSGKLALIRDPSLQSALAQLRGIDGDVEELRLLLFDLSRNGAVAVGRHARVASSGGELPGQGLFGALWGREALRALGNDRDARSVAIAKISYWAGYQIVLGRLQAQLDVVMGMIDAELDDAA